MRVYRKLYITVLFTIIMVFSSVTSFSGSTMTAQAATIKINYKTLTLETGKTKTLKIKGTEKKVKWASSNKEVATVSSKGKVTAKAVGTATITATVSAKKLSCKVTVVKPANPYLKNAPFNAIETNLEGYNFVMPSDWEGTLNLVSDNSYSITLTPPKASLGSKIVITFLTTGEKAPSFSVLKSEISKRLTLDSVTKNYSGIFGNASFAIDNFSQDKQEASFASIMKTQYTVTSDSAFEQCIYDFYLDNYFIEVTTYDYETLDLSTAAEYVINSIRAE